MKEDKSTKLYQIKRKSDGYFFNAKDKFFTSKLCIGTYNPSRKQIELQINHFGLNETCEVYESTELQFTEDMAGMTTKAIIQAESLKKQLEDIKYILPTVSSINKNTGNFLGKAISHLKLISPMFNKFAKTHEDSTYDIIGGWDEFIDQVSKTELYECSAATVTLKALKNDPTTLNRTVNKINYNNGQ